MKISDEQVLAQLKVQSEKLKLQLERIEIAINDFAKSDAVNEVKKLTALVENKGFTNNNGYLDTALPYRPSMSVDKKILYVLREIGYGDIDDIVQHILRVDGHIKDPKRVYTRITYITGRMLKVGKITTVRIGKKSVYKLAE